MSGSPMFLSDRFSASSIPLQIWIRVVISKTVVKMWLWLRNAILWCKIVLVGWLRAQVIVVVAWWMVMVL